mmetsp:Transcript_61036/g.189068  ORF Transcript_61036/g.189068 Transcript_61036/m.189068 type:complete len:285 (+) Transcript_61036:40-894(+)
MTRAGISWLIGLLGPVTARLVVEGVLEHVCVVQHHVPLSVEPCSFSSPRFSFGSSPVRPRASREDLLKVELRGCKVWPVAHPRHGVQEGRPRVPLAGQVPICRLPLAAVLGPEEPHVVDVRVAAEPVEYEGHVDVPGDRRVVLRQVHHGRQRALCLKKVEDPVEHLGLVRPLAVLEDSHLSSKLLAIPCFEVGQLLLVVVRRGVWKVLHALSAVCLGQGVPSHDDLCATKAQDVANAADGGLQHLQAGTGGILLPCRGGDDGGDMLVHVLRGVVLTREAVLVRL